MDTLRERIDATRIRDTQDEATARANEVKARERGRREKQREANRVLWIERHFALAATHRQIALDHEQRAAALLVGGS